MDSKEPIIITYKETLAQSLISDAATFGLLLLSVYVSQGSNFWTFVTGCLFLLFVIGTAASLFRSDRRLDFHSLDDMQAWLDEQKQAANNRP